MGGTPEQGTLWGQDTLFPYAVSTCVSSEMTTHFTPSQGLPSSRLGEYRMEMPPPCPAQGFLLHSHHSLSRSHTPSLGIMSTWGTIWHRGAMVTSDG